MLYLSLSVSLFVFAIVVANAHGPFLAYAIQNGYQTYENIGYGITLQYPSEWEEVDDGILGGYFYDTKNVVVEFLPSNESLYFRQDDQITHESLALIISNYTDSNKSIDEQLSDFGNQRKSSIKVTCPDFEILYENTNATLSYTHPAHRIAYNYTHGGTVYAATEIWTIKDGKSYHLAFGGQESSYENLSSEIDNMFNSFKIIS